MRTSLYGNGVAVLLTGLALAGCSDSTTPATAPAAPSSLSAAATTTQITLTWLLPPGAVDEVQIQRSINGAAFVALTTLKPASGTYTDVGVTAGTSYKYEVQACDAGMCSTATEVAVSTPTSNNQTQLAVWNPALPPSLVNYPYTPVLRTTGGAGGAATWSLVSGALPSGVRLNADGTFAGTPTVTGIYPVTVKATAGGATAQRTLSIQIFAPDQTRFNITRMDVAPVSPDIEPAVAGAISRWESIITGDLTMDTLTNGFFKSSDCGGWGQAAEGAYVDDMFLIVNIDPLPSNILGQATVCGYRVSGETSVVGILTLNSTVLARYAGTETLNNIVFHEIGHTLGYGVLWDDARYDAGNFDYVASGTCVYDASGNLTVGTNPTYTGANAVREWNAGGGTGSVPLEDQGGPGTACSHWRKATFSTEVMTGYVEPVGTAQQVSRITLASMVDLGFKVDLSKADPYKLPQASAGLRAPSPWTIGGDLLIPSHWEDVQVGGRPRPLGAGSARARR